MDAIRLFKVWLSKHEYRALRWNEQQLFTLFCYLKKKVFCIMLVAVTVLKASNTVSKI